MFLIWMCIVRYGEILIWNRNVFIWLGLIISWKRNMFLDYSPIIRWIIFANCIIKIRKRWEPITNRLISISIILSGRWQLSRFGSVGRLAHGSWHQACWFKMREYLSTFRLIGKSCSGSWCCSIRLLYQRRRTYRWKWMLAIVRLRYKVSMMWMVFIMYRQGLSGTRYRKN